MGKHFPNFALLEFMYELLVQEFILKCICCCSIAKLSLTHCDPTDCSTPGLPVLHYLPKFGQIHVHCVNDAIQPSHPLLPPSPPALNVSQRQSLRGNKTLKASWKETLPTNGRRMS